MKYLLITITLLWHITATAQRYTRLLYFGFGQHQLSQQATETLQHLHDSVTSNNQVTAVYLYGHTDSVGRPGFNDSLSLRRVNAVKEWLLQLGIPDSVIKTQRGYGKSRPLNNNLSENERQANRRVELTLVTGKSKTGKPATTTLKAAEVKGNIDASHLQEGSKLVLRNINFEGGRHVFLPGSYPALKNLLKVLQDNPGLEIRILGYICCMPESLADGPDMETGLNNLSHARAKAVADYLIKYGISQTRIKYQGMGASNKLNADLTEAEHTQNRRVEIEVLKR